MNKTYQQAIEELEQIVQKIETGRIDLSILPSEIKKAQELIVFCQNKITETEKQIMSAGS